MIAFATFFLGLVAGPQSVEVIVSSRVASVQLVLDDRLVATLQRGDPEPWTAAVDFGTRLTRHELIAIALDENSVEIARTQQLLNHSRQRVAAHVLLDGWHNGAPRTARVTWQSADTHELVGLSASLDGTQLGTVEPNGFDIPETDPQQIHFLTVDLALAGSRTATAEAVFGGRFQDTVPAELTAVALSGLGGNRRAKTSAGRRIKTRENEPAAVVAIDHGPAELVFVRTADSLPWLEELDVSLQRKGRGRGVYLAKHDHLLIMSAQPRASDHPDRKYSLFPVSPRFSAQDYSIPQALGRIGFVEPASSTEQVTNAVAVAGLQAAALKRRRIVVLLTSNCDTPSGTWSAQTVRDYLSELNVPLVIWQFGGKIKKREESGFCSGARHIASDQVYTHEIRRVLTELADQDIVWVEGPAHHLRIDG